jgi:hypothetical protein
MIQDYNKEERLTAQISQRTLIIILPLVFATFVTGKLREKGRVEVGGRGTLLFLSTLAEERVSDRMPLYISTFVNK